ncbi:unnamed protein product [Prorocentrum cordatum]|uniref:Uncharacterized protein n=1 Tax=Prorocentrum cordatum TaxID=2364126 RepID=A0ABN9Q5K0_9DINO|nr:unnamed protein product [Polarella glacialis]
MRAAYVEGKGNDVLLQQDPARQAAKCWSSMPPPRTSLSHPPRLCAGSCAEGPHQAEGEWAGEDTTGGREEGTVEASELQTSPGQLLPGSLQEALAATRLQRLGARDGESRALSTSPCTIVCLLQCFKCNPKPKSPASHPVHHSASLHDCGWIDRRARRHAEERRSPSKRRSFPSSDALGEDRHSAPRQLCRVDTIYPQEGPAPCMCTVGNVRSSEAALRKNRVTHTT